MMELSNTAYQNSTWTPSTDSHQSGGKVAFRKVKLKYIFQLFDIFYRQFYFAGLSRKNGANVA
jgi:hypothetical protein